MSQFPRTNIKLSSFIQVLGFPSCTTLKTCTLYQCTYSQSTLPCNILSETSQPDADRDGEEVATDAVPQNQSNNGNQSLSPSEDKMAEVLEEANEEEESTKSPERTSEKSSPEEEQPGNN